MLCLKHRLIPASLNYKQENPEIDFSHSPFYVNTQLQTWHNELTPRCAGVSSFGIGGTNAHIVLQEAAVARSLEVSQSDSSQAWHIIILSARSISALNHTIINLSNHLRQHPEHSLADIAFTLQQGRHTFKYKCFFVVNSTDSLIEQIDSKNGYSNVKKDYVTVSMEHNSGSLTSISKNKQESKKQEKIPA